MSDVKIISTKDAPAAIGPYVQGKVIGGFLFASGQIPLVPATGAMAEGGIAEQARQALNNVKALVFKELESLLITFLILFSCNSLTDGNFLKSKRLIVLVLSALVIFAKFIIVLSSFIYKTRK